MSDVVDIALEDLHLAEDPPHSNAGPVMKFALRGEPPAAWCGRAVRFWFNRWGHPLPGNPWLLGSCSELQRALELAGAWVPAEAAVAFLDDGVGAPAALPSRGDIFILNEGAISDTGKVGHHTGIVIALDRSARMVTSIEGNWSDRVQRVTRKLKAGQKDAFWGFGKWPLPAMPAAA